MSDSSRVLGREFELLAHEILRHAPHSGIFFSDGQEPFYLQQVFLVQHQISLAELL